MNVVMPTAMSTIHQDEELRECASKTAQNGKMILRLLNGDRDVMNNCKAISRVCNDSVMESEEQLEDLVEVSYTFCNNLL